MAPLKVRVVAQPVASETEAVNANDDGDEGVPEITPVEAFNVTPDRSEPETPEYVSAPVPRRTAAERRRGPG